MQSFYDSNTYLIFDASIITSTALKAAGDYTLKMLVQQVSHLSLKNYFCVDLSKKKINPDASEMVQKKLGNGTVIWRLDLTLITGSFHLDTIFERHNNVKHFN